MFWGLKNIPDRCSYNGSILALLFDTEKDFAAILNKEMGRLEPTNTMDRVICSHPSMFGRNMMGIVLQRDQDIYNYVLGTAVEDWGGEARFILAALGLLNARNTSETIAVDKSAHNQKRLRKGQYPFFSHDILKIHPLQLKYFKESQDPKARNGELHSHFVRGHWKERKSGLYWWNTFRRGNIHRGLASKDYQVEI